MSIDLATAEPSVFEPFIGATFTITAGEAEVPVILDNVKIFEGSDVRDSVVEIDGKVLPPRKAFALTFEGPLEPQLGQGMYRFDHAEAGVLDLFLSPFRRDHNCMLYETVFN